MSLVITESDIVLVDENHQWPLPRLQASLSEDMKGKQFTVKQREKINNIETLVCNKNDFLYSVAIITVKFHLSIKTNINKNKFGQKDDLNIKVSY